MPSEFKLNNNPNTILDDFLINSYTKERLPNTSQLNSNELDLFLQTQTKPTLKNKFKDKKPFFTPERGLTIHGAVNANSEGQCKILLTSKENEIIEFAPLKADKTFTFNNLILNNTSNYNLSLINENGELINAAFFIYNSNKSYKPDSLLVKNKSYLTTTNSKKTDTHITPNYNISYQNAEILEEVVLEGKSKTNKNLYPKLPTGPGTNFFKKLNFDEKDAYNFTVIEYLNNQSGIHAFDQAKIDRSEGFEKVDYISVIFRRNRAASLYGSPEALILIDGLPVDNEILKNMRLNQVESIELNPNGSGYGFRGGKGVVAIQLKKGGENKIKTSGPSTSYTSLPDFGYTGSSPYYFPPALIFNTNTSQRFYETLDWVPNYNVLPNMSNELKLYKGDHDNVTLFINGMNKNGGLVYKEIEIPL
ncbi:hypothetical protein [Formosa sp. A9]|uniref:hypothetical protein n=1 Tax=Formosa sp. A9 TaxID=3442641 RepID=UPI003EBF9BB6